MSRAALACVIASTLLAACGARSDLHDAELTDAAVPDRLVADASPPPRALGIWRFHTIRALCDTFAVAFCDDGRLLVRLSFDDLCDGANPVGERPSLATAVWTSPEDVTLEFDAGVGHYSVMLRLVEGAVLAEDRFELVAWDGDLSGFPWDHGVRAETIRPPLPAGFVSCE